MKKQLVNISPIQTAKVLAVLYFVISLPFILIMAIPVLMSPASTMPLLVLLAMPFFYLAIGFISTLIGAAIYNLVASKIGGIEVTVRDVDTP